MKNFKSYPQPIFARITDVNDSMHCYAENDVVQITAEFIEDGEKFYVASQTGTDFQQQIRKAEWVKYTRKDAERIYPGLSASVCAPETTAEPFLIHWFYPGEEIKIIAVHYADSFKVEATGEQYTQTIDIRDLSF